MFKLQFIVKEELENYGFHVKLTRTKNTDLPLKNRGQMAKGYDLFISLHSNACNNEKVDRVVVIKGYDTKGTLGEELASAITKTMGTSKPQVMTRLNDSGTDYYGVLRNARIVNCNQRFIIENGFHTNKRCAEWLSNERNLKMLGKSIADTIANHLGLTVSHETKLIRVIKDVNYRSRADFSKDEYIEGVAKKGEVFTVVNRVKSNCSIDMYQLKSGYFITTSSKYVEEIK